MLSILLIILAFAGLPLGNVASRRGWPETLQLVIPLASLILFCAAISVSFATHWTVGETQRVELRTVPSNGNQDFLVTNTDSASGGFAFVRADSNPIRVETANLNDASVVRDAGSGTAWVNVTTHNSRLPWITPLEQTRFTYEFHVPSKEN